MSRQRKYKGVTLLIASVLSFIAGAYSFSLQEKDKKE